MCASDDAPIDETTRFTPRFNADGLIPAVVTEAQTGRLLMLAYMNADALQRTLETRDAWYWSRSRGKLWRKGETSGHVQKVVDVRTDCDQDAIQLIVEQTGAACHTGRPDCFYRSVGSDGALVFDRPDPTADAPDRS
ncbi:MAG: phosphoribosyl-AMP cyclohydrolase [Pseudomonadota bacterium]